MKKRTVTMVSLLLVLVLSAGLMAGCGGGKQKKYTVHFGLNDADTGEQILTMDGASKTIRGIITGKGFGYTEYRAYGGYVEDEQVKGNDTLVYLMTFMEEEDMTAIVDEAKKELNLASVLIEEDTVSFSFSE